MAGYGASPIMQHYCIYLGDSLEMQLSCIYFVLLMINR